MRILVTGGAGFIGSHLVEAALAAGHEVAVVDDLSSGRRANVPDGAAFFHADVRDEVRLREAFARFRPEAVAHQAAQASVSASVREPLRDAEVNLLGSLRVLEACRAFGARSFVFASTGGAIYGEVPEGARATVDTAPAPVSPYAASKLAVEGYLPVYRAQYGLRCASLRYANVYGPRQDPHGEAGVVAIFAQRVLAGEALSINAMRAPGDDGCVRDYVFVADVVRANLAALEGRLGVDVLNVGTGVETTTRALARRIAEAAGRPLTAHDREKRAGDLERSVLDPSEYVRRLGPMTPLDEGLRATVAWFSARSRAARQD
jgi:UDP-glucose 4-epimerase